MSKKDRQIDEKLRGMKKKRNYGMYYLFGAAALAAYFLWERYFRYKTPEGVTTSEHQNGETVDRLISQLRDMGDNQI